MRATVQRHASSRRAVEGRRRLPPPRAFGSQGTVEPPAVSHLAEPVPPSHDFSQLAPSGPVQAYSEMGEGMLWGYGQGVGGAAPGFEFQTEEVTKTPNNAQSTMTYGVLHQQIFMDMPTVRVSDNNDLAAPVAEGAEAKSFFATAGAIAQSNIDLAAAGAPLQLIQGAGTIRLPIGWNPFGPTLFEVSPDLTNVVNNATECGAFAHNILGVNIGSIQFEPVGGAEVHNVGGLGRDAQINTALNARDPETLGANTSADPDVGEAFGIFARHQVPAPNWLQTVWNGIGKVHDYFATKPHMQWGEHWAGVVAKSGGDYVTLENYNRAASGTDLVLEAMEKDYAHLKGNNTVNDYQQASSHYERQGMENGAQRLYRLGTSYMRFAAKIGQIAGHYANDTDRWYFAMYGQGKQSFHEKWKDSAPNAVTAKVT